VYPILDRRFRRLYELVEEEEEAASTAPPLGAVRVLAR
jgi:hypothetical protein